MTLPFGHKKEWLPIESMPGVDWKLASPHGRNSPAMPTTVSLARTIYAQKIAQSSNLQYNIWNSTRQLAVDASSRYYIYILPKLLTFKLFWKINFIKENVYLLRNLSYTNIEKKKSISWYYYARNNIILLYNIISFRTAAVGQVSIPSWF